MNRKQFKETDDTAIWDTYSSISKNMKEIEEMQIELDSFIKDVDACQKLREYVEK